MEDLKSLRSKYRLTQKEAAELLGVSHRTWQNWEGGINKMKPQFYELFLIKLHEKKGD